MTIRRSTMTWLAIVAMLVALPASAEVFTVKLKNGSSFESRYRPQIAGWDESKLLVVTGIGTRISLPLEELDEIVADSELKGFGTVINTTTIALGWAPNDSTQVSPEEMDPADRLLSYLQQQQSARPDYSVEQFVDVEDAGLGGLPSWSFTPAAVSQPGVQLPGQVPPR